MMGALHNRWTRCQKLRFVAAQLARSVPTKSLGMPRSALGHQLVKDPGPAVELQSPLSTVEAGL